MPTIQRISEEQLEPKIVNSLNNIVKNEGFVNHEKIVRTLSTNGGNFLGDLLEVDIQGKSGNGEKEINLFIKQIKQGGLPDFLYSDNFQDREILVYGELATLYTQLMNEANIPENERYHQARCFDANYEFIILENLAVRGFETLERTAPFTLSFTESAVKVLAKFHALSFVLKSKQPEYFNENLKKLRFPQSLTNDFFKILKDSLDISCNLLDDNSAKRLRAAYETIINTEKYYGEAGSPKCLCHGDFRGLNILFKEENGTITELLPVDFQMLHYGNPMTDFWYLLTVHTEREFRRKHLTTLKELYYDTLTQFLKYFDIDVSSVYPRKEFEVDYKDQSIYGLYSTMVILSFLFSREDAAPQINDINSLKNHVKLQDGAKDRLQGVVDDFINWGII